jgi:hypothetical protein
MTDLVEHHEPREGGTSRTRQQRKVRVLITAPVPQEREDSPQRAEQIDRARVDHRVE